MTEIEKRILLLLNSLSWELPASFQHNNETELHNTLNTVLSSPGKRVRPFLTLLMSELFEVEEKQAKILARVVEMIHVASLIHDDVIDVEKQRRSCPTINAHKENRLAVLAGDFLLSKALQELSHCESLPCYLEVTQSICELVEGEWLQAEHLFKNLENEETLLKICRLKTGSLISLSTVLPSVLKSSSPALREQAKKVGENLGLAFQFFDDIWDHSPNNPRGAGSDLKEGIPNIVDMLMSRDRISFEEAKDVALTRARNYLDLSLKSFAQLLELLHVNEKKQFVELYEKRLQEIERKFLA